MSRRSEERGTVLLLVSVATTVIVTMGAFAVDLGMQRVARRDMQTLADVVAQDLARLVNGRAASTILSGSNGYPSLAEALRRSVARNDDTTVGAAPDVDAVLVRVVESGPDAGRPERDAAGNVVVLTGPGQVPTGVLVTAETTVAFAFGSGSGGASRSAVGQVRPEACFRAGSYAAAFDSGGSALLAPVLGAFLHADASAVSYEALARVDVTALGIVEATGSAGTVDQALEQEVAVARVAEVLVDVLSSDPRDVVVDATSAATAQATTSSAVAALEVVADLAASADVLQSVRLADVLGIEQGGSAALSATANVLDVVMTSAELANGTNLVSVPDLALSLAPFGTVRSSLELVEGPQRRCGPVGTTVETGQADVEVVAQLAGATRHVSHGGNVVIDFSPQPDLAATPAVDEGAGDVVVSVGLSQATATLVGMVCGEATSTATAEGIDVSVATGVASRTSVTLGRARVTGTLLGNSDVRLDLTVDLPDVATLSTPASGPQSFRHPPQSYDDPIRFATGTVSPGVAAAGLDIDGTVTVETGLLDYTVSVTDGSVTGVLSITALNVLSSNGILSVGGLQSAVGSAVGTAVAGVVNPALAQLRSVVLDPLQPLLGIGVAGADVYAEPRPGCAGARLVG